MIEPFGDLPCVILLVPCIPINEGNKYARHLGFPIRKHERLETFRAVRYMCFDCSELVTWLGKEVMKYVYAFDNLLAMDKSCIIVLLSYVYLDVYIIIESKPVFSIELKIVQFEYQSNRFQ